MHPGEANDSALGRYAWGYRWADELAALIDPRAKTAVGELGFELTTFRRPRILGKNDNLGGGDRKTRVGASARRVARSSLRPNGHFARRNRCLPFGIRSRWDRGMLS